MPPRGGEGKGERGGFPPVRKSLGQHFLTDKDVLQRIADSAELNDGDTLLEIGPGRGALTDLLVDRVKRLVAIEYDRALAAQLTERYASRKNVQIIQADVLSVRFGELARGPYKLLGNVPYYITTPIIFQALEKPRPDIAVYLVQREVAERLVAPPGGGDYGALTVNVGAVADVEILFKVPGSAFRPPPKVESAVVRVTPKANALVGAKQEEGFRAFVQSVFTMRRKQLQRILRSIANLPPEEAERWLNEVGIAPTARPETLSVEDFARLFSQRRGSSAQS
jgi:16S rRNA (adenine1518-N6/adenine1519-N6)-dimethyltransferase